MGLNRVYGSINEDFNIRHGKGFIPFYVYTKGEYSEEVLTIVELSGEEKKRIDEITEEYFHTFRRFWMQ